MNKDHKLTTQQSLLPINLYSKVILLVKSTFSFQHTVTIVTLMITDDDGNYKNNNKDSNDDNDDKQT